MEKKAEQKDYSAEIAANWKALFEAAKQPCTLVESFNLAVQAANLHCFEQCGQGQK